MGKYLSLVNQLNVNINHYLNNITPALDFYKLVTQLTQWLHKTREKNIKTGRVLCLQSPRILFFAKHQFLFTSL